MKSSGLGRRPTMENHFLSLCYGDSSFKKQSSVVTLMETLEEQEVSYLVFNLMYKCLRIVSTNYFT